MISGSFEERWIRGIAQVDKREKMIWPAVMLAANRRHKVTGRKNTLIDSISTNGEASQLGAPVGRNPAANCLKNGSADRIRANHIGRPRGIVRIRWAVGFDE